MPKFLFMGVVHMKNKKKKTKILNIILIVLIVISFIFLLLSIYTIIKEYNNLRAELNYTITIQQEEIKEKDKTINELKSIISSQDEQLLEVSNINKSYVDELNELRSRSELYDKYSYAIINECNERTELTYSEIKLGEQLMAEKGYDPNLMFGTIMVESGGNPLAINEDSGATGYGQFLNSTAEFVWTNLLGNDTYNPEIMKDGKSNIKMMAEYYDYLYSTNGSTFKVIKQYSGNITDEGAMNYLAKINNYTQKVGIIIQ